MDIKIVLFLGFAILCVNVFGSEPDTGSDTGDIQPFVYSQDNDLTANVVNAGATVGSIIGHIIAPGVGGIIGGAIGGVAGFILCSFFCDEPDPPDTTDPTIHCPTVNSVYYTEAGQREAIVTYANARASDNDAVASVGQYHPQDRSSGSSFPVGQHRISFIAYDRTGNSKICDIQFTVEARTCDYPIDPEDGDVHCQDTPPGYDPVFGETCTYSCDTGYNLIGDDIQTCGQNNDWPGGGPVTCQIMTCDPPLIPENAQIDSCTADYDYDSVCVFTCFEGFEIPVGNERSLRCGEDEWIGEVSTCEDIESPVIHNCPDTMTVYLRASVDYAIATWDIPTATDNVDDFVSISQESGREPGSQFPIEPDNVYHIVYGAMDTAGNVAIDCEFSIIVQAISCPPIEHAFRLNVSCPDGQAYGARCDFQCDQGYPLIGPSEVFCEMTDDNPPVGYWNWGEDLSSPYCEVIFCPDLDLPDNGALSCANWLHGIACQMSCNENWDIPRSAPTDGEFVCADTIGEWRPNDIVPDCSEVRTPGSMRLPSELFYFSGDCTSNETQQQIQQHFIDNLLQSDYVELCTLYPDCAAENVNVMCGASSRKRRDLSQHRNRRDVASTYEVIVTFDFVLRDIYDPSRSGAEMDALTYDQFNELTEWFTSFVQQGGMDIDGLDVVADSFRFGESLLNCSLGTLTDYSTFTCRPCATGTMYDSTFDNCTYCPVGTYQDTDGASYCIDCPDGYTTIDIGSRSTLACIAKCTPGYYSSNGIAPCAACPLGTYSNDVMQTSCIECPENTNTSNIGASSILHCVSEVVPGGHCADDPCNSHGVCVTRNEHFVCYCTNGYSGTHCEVSPNACANHICQNGATCADGEEENEYVCECEPGYVGDLCQHRKVDGGWAEWGTWSECSVTCGDGVQLRHRRCDNPSPNSYGDGCSGNNVTSQTCNSGDCPECPPAPSGRYGTRVQCSEDGTNKTCNIVCLEGRVSTQEFPFTLTCGPYSNHTWDPNVLQSELPTCGGARYSDTIRQQSRVIMEAPMPTDQEINEFSSAIEVLAENQLHCLDIGQCEINIDATQSDSTRRKRAIVEILVTIEASVGDYDFMRSGSYDPDIAANGLVSMAWLITQLENMALTLEELLQNSTLTMTVNGIDYAADSFSTSGELGCSGGEQSASVFCAGCSRINTPLSVSEFQFNEQNSITPYPAIECPPGTYGDGFDCTLCGIGEYQPLEAQTSCVACEEGLTTVSFGSTNTTDCIEDDTDLDDNQLEENDIGESNGQNGNKKRTAEVQNGTLVGVVMAVIVVLLCAAILSAILVSKKIKRNDRVAPSRPNSPQHEDKFPLTARDIDLKPPPYNANTSTALEIKDTALSKHQSLPPLDHTYTLRVKNKIQELSNKIRHTKD